MLKPARRLFLALSILCPLIFNASHANEINVSGSTSVARLMDVLAEDYNKSHPDTYIAVQGIGSTAGVTLLKKHVADIAMSSRYLTESELESNLKVELLAYDGIAVVVNVANPVKDVTREQLYKIYKGEITNWQQLGGPNQKIAVVTREASSGTRYSFESLVGLTRVVNDRLVSDISPNNLVVNSNSMVKTLVNHNPQAIGFISTGSVDRSIKALTFEGIEVSAETIANGKYQLYRPFLILNYPETSKPEANQFMEYLLSTHVRELVTEYGYIPSLVK